MEIEFHVSRPPYAEVDVVLEVYAEGDETVCGLRFLRGEINMGPKALRDALRTEVRKIEDIARSAGCTEMRHAGDDRGWFLPDYEKMPELKNGRRKKL